MIVNSHDWYGHLKDGLVSSKQRRKDTQKKLTVLSIYIQMNAQSIILWSNDMAALAVQKYHYKHCIRMRISSIATEIQGSYHTKSVGDDSVNYYNLRLFALHRIDTSDWRLAFRVMHENNRRRLFIYKGPGKDNSLWQLVTLLRPYIRMWLTSPKCLIHGSKYNLFDASSNPFKSHINLQIWAFLFIMLAKVLQAHRTAIARNMLAGTNNKTPAFNIRGDPRVVTAARNSDGHRYPIWRTW